MPARTHDVSSTPAPSAACDVCPHDLDGHDTIGLRFCQATLDGALTRGCACPPASAATRRR
jgi:hypothetical protein